MWYNIIMAKKALLELEKNVDKYLETGLRQAALRTLEREKQNIGLTDHSLEELKQLGHPYNQESPVKIHNSLPGNEYGPVHIQSGNLRNSLTIWQEKKDTYTIGLKDWNNPTYAIKVIEGILPNGKGYRGMVPRDFPFSTITEVVDQKIIYDIIESAIKEAIKRS